MIITSLRQDLIVPVRQLMELGAPYVRARTDSDYWLYARLFSSSCPVALIDDTVVGAVIAMRSQDEPDEVYIQDVMIHPQHRRTGIAAVLLQAVGKQAEHWQCRRIYLTSEPDNKAAFALWRTLGFVNTPGQYEVNGVSVTKDYKGPGKDRAIFELALTGRVHR